jgi:tRNA (adenine37-N6)-methyltransferase
MEFTLKPIGTVRAGKTFAVELEEKYTAGLEGLKGFSHVIVVWYADKNPKWKAEDLTMDKPYRLAPARLGVFATRSSHRPNPICVSVAAVSSIDAKKGLVKLWWTDAEDGTPVLDVKPYYHCSEYARDAKTPEWSAHWPACYEESGDFDWGSEFLFGN